MEPAIAGGKVEMRLTVLTENLVNKRGLLAEHGLSVLVEAKGRRILFDTGQTDVFLKNAQALGISLEKLDAVVLSHGHYDHGGGLEAVIREGLTRVIYAGKGAFEKKLAGDRDGNLREIGLGLQAQVTENEGLLEIFPDIFLLARIPKLADFEGVSPAFAVNRDGKIVKDEMQDEQMLLIREGKKLHVIAGCCHMGIVSSLRYVKQKFPGEALGTVLAGMHLRSAGEKRLSATIEALGQLDPERLVPVHCTGMMAIARMKLAFGEKCVLAEAGKVLEG